MVTYILFISIIMALLILNSAVKQNANIFQILAFCLIVFFVGFRFETGYDWAMYRNFFEYNTLKLDSNLDISFFIFFIPDNSVFCLSFKALTSLAY